MLSLDPQLEWFTPPRLPAPPPPSPPWTIKLYKSGMTFERGAWDALGGPRQMDIGWDAEREALWMVARATGEIPIKPDRGHHATAKLLRMGTPRMMAFILGHGFLPALYEMWPAVYRPEQAFAWVIPRASRHRLTAASERIAGVPPERLIVPEFAP